MVAFNDLSVSADWANKSLAQSATRSVTPTSEIAFVLHVPRPPKSSRVESNGSLIIENVTQSDLGQYVCTARNDLGTKSHSVTLKLGILFEIILFICN